MKKLLSSILAITLLAISAGAWAIESDAENICIYVAEDNKRLFNKVLRKNNMVLKRVHGAVRCNGRSLLEFADDKGSTKTGSYIISRLPKSKVSKVTLKDEVLQKAKDKRLK